MNQRMKTLLLTFAFALVFTNAARGQTSPPPESAQPLSEELALKALDLSWHQAVAGHDADALGRLLADDYRFDLDARRFLTKAQEIEAVRSSSDALYAIDPFKLKEVKVKIEGERAIVTGILAVIPKEDKSARRRYFYTRTFVQRDGRWQIRTSGLVTLFGEDGS